MFMYVNRFMQKIFACFSKRFYLCIAIEKGRGYPKTHKRVGTSVLNIIKLRRL